MLTRTLAVLLGGGVLAANALPEPLRPHAEMQSPYAFYPTNKVPIGASDYTSASEAPEGFGIDTKPVDRTIYQILNAVPHFSKLAKVVNISDEIVSLLNDTSAGITFFAVPDWALKPPHHRKPHHHNHDGENSQHLSADNDTPYDLEELVFAVEDLEHSFDKPDKDCRKKIIKKIVTAILAYHILPEGLDSQQLAQNLTFSTNLTLHDGSLDGEPFRVRVQKVIFPPKLNVNLYSEVVKPDIRAKNGIMHVVNHPLLPPPSVFQELFILPSAFSFLTSGLQRVGLTNALDLRYVPGKGEEKGSLQGAPSVTLFTPTNRAFKRLPPKLLLFLFSPFGERVLKKLLEFHVVPGLIVHSDYFHNASSDSPFFIFNAVENLDLPESDHLDLESLLFEPRSFDEESIDGSSWVCDGDSESVDESYEYDCAEESQDLCDDMEDHFPCEDYCYADFSHHSPPLRHADPPHLFPEHSPDEHHHLVPLPRGHRHISYPYPLSPAPPNHHTLWGPPPPCHYPHDPHHRIFFSPVYAVNLTLPSLLSNHSHFIQITKYKFTLPVPGPKRGENYVTRVIVDGQSVALSDLVARNGAAHVVGNLLNPRRHYSGHNESDDCDKDDDKDGWDDWEDWLVQWAAEN